MSLYWCIRSWFLRPFYPYKSRIKISSIYPYEDIEWYSTYDYDVCKYILSHEKQDGDKLAIYNDIFYRMQDLPGVLVSERLGTFYEKRDSKSFVQEMRRLYNENTSSSS